jgi:hypothetical protein
MTIAGIAGSMMATRAKATMTHSLAEIMLKPLIIGASVSADRATNSPGKRLALRYTPATEIKTIAMGGMPSTKVLPMVKAADLKDRTIVIGIDLFFWDSALPSSKESIQGLQRLIERTSALNIPLVLGEVPELLPGMQPSRVAINKAIVETCKATANCSVMNFDLLLQQVLNDGYLSVKGRKYTLQELVPDGLHMGAVLSEELANRLASKLAEKN